MADHVPQLEPKMLERVAALRGLPAVEAAFEVCAEEVERAMAEQIRISETESPTFAEKVRGELIMELLREYGLTDVVMDESGNVVGRRPGTGAGPVLAIAAHLDTVFPAGTDLKVTKDGALYRGPGIGDNASGLRSMLQVLPALNRAQIATTGDILFVGTVGEEGNGDIRGAKALFDGSRQIDGFIALDMADVNTVQNGATGAHRWRVAIEGTGGHSYLDYGMVPSAIHAMGRALNVIADFDPPSDPKTTFTVGTIKGGTTVKSMSTCVQSILRSLTSWRKRRLTLSGSALSSKTSAGRKPDRNVSLSSFSRRSAIVLPVCSPMTLRQFRRRSAR